MPYAMYITLHMGGGRFGPFFGIIINAALMLCALLLAAACLEGLLRIGWFEGLDDPRPVWIPRKYKNLTEEMNNAHKERGRLNWNGFNDTTDFIRRDGNNLVIEDKPLSRKRIVVLGDSVIWGYGLPFDSIWVNKFERDLMAAGIDATVSNWSIYGWETIDHFVFMVRLMEYLRERALPHDIDLLIVNFTFNDVNMNTSFSKELKWQESRALAPVRAAFPNALDFISSYANKFAYDRGLDGYGMDNFTRELYSEKNFATYAAMLRDFGDYCRLHGIPLLFIVDDDRSDHMNKIIDLIGEHNVEHLYIRPEITEEFGDTNPRKLWANPGDGHPGDEIHSVYAREVFRYLDEKGVFAASRVSARNPVSKIRTSEERKILSRLAAIHMKRKEWYAPPGKSFLTFDIESVLVAR